ncbi:unnamed protein product [Sphagnum jensenii]|uniref:Uncharacterized protein n=1 Tax=Sphagnum jensenii TaxID=128206 RepID=A0ABP1BJH8_9BRYO
MDPLLNAGTKQPLEAADVPLLGASDLTLTVYRKLQSKWLQQEESSRSVWRASANAFWPQFVVIGGIVFAKSIVVYVGSLLIQRFSDFTAGTSRNYEYEGCVGRQSHGVGNIVSYMSTDSIYLLHNTWVLPLQLLLAMGVLSCSVGTAAIAGFGVLVIVAASSLLVAQKQQLCQVQVQALISLHPFFFA